ncbi:MAG: carbohydrate binding family 9 domain-containing protein [Gemmatimonadaceae bacterium]
MLLPFLLAAVLDSAPTTDVQPPRIEASVEVDGRLDEAVWEKAAALRGFSQYSPADGRPADDSTTVLVWYSPTAIHFGVRAYERHGDPATTVRATLADRDRISGDDNVQLLLGTFDDGRQATVFAVNPLGVQGDGTLVETGRTAGGFMANAQQTREPADLSPDFVFQSKGRLTGYGYEVEIRIPFKSLRYQPTDVQRWAINVVRQVQHSGHEDTWAPARRSGSSFLAQSGHLEGLTDLRRGLVLDLNPTVTHRTDGAPRMGPGGVADGWTYDAGRPDVGGNVRWGVTNNLTLNGTVNPDFSQVEADAGQFSFDPRSALYFAERRPFFLEGSEQFTVPNQLIYTRRIVQPVAATKLTGKVSGTDVALLSAFDDRGYSVDGSRPMFNIVRLQRDLGNRSRIGMAYTDKLDGDASNRVLDVDGRLVFRDLYSLQFQVAGSRDERDGETVSAPLWDLRLVRSGRAFGLNYRLGGISEDFRTLSGFISRPGLGRASASHRYTMFGDRGAFIESFNTELLADGTWKYRGFLRGDDALEKKLHLNTTASLRGGCSAGASVLVEQFGFDPDLYAGYMVERPAGDGAPVDTVPFTGTPNIGNLDWVINLGTPQLGFGSASLFLIWGRDENFYEWAPADIRIGTLTINLRPTDKLRIDGTYQQQRYDRRSDGSTVFVRHIPRVKAEYQIARPLFVRLIGEYDLNRQDALRDDSRTGGRLLVPQGDGTVAHDVGGRSNVFRGDALISYQPTPGTVFFAGYGSLLREDEPLRFGRTMRRTSDGFFVKGSYLFRM